VTLDVEREVTMNVSGVDLTDGGVLNQFSDKTSVFFGAEFLYAHRSDDGNRVLPKESGKIG